MKFPRVGVKNGLTANKVLQIARFYCKTIKSLFKKEDENKVFEPTNTDFNSIHLIREKINLVYGEKGRKMAS